MSERRLPTPAERSALRRAAAEVSKGDQSVDEARQRQKALWANLIANGVIKAAIARESGISQTGLNSRMASGRKV